MSDLKYNNIACPFQRKGGNWSHVARFLNSLDSMWDGIRLDNMDIWKCCAFIGFAEFPVAVFFFFLLWHRLYLQTLRWSQMWPLHALYAKWKKNINSQSFQPVQSFCSINTPATKGSIRFANEEANRRCRTHRRLKGNQMHLRLSVLHRKLMSVPMCAHSLFSRFINPRVHIVLLHNSVILKLSAHDGT